jgi:hypothetical protein
MSCPFAHDAGAYVLGALSPAERLEFEQHLPGCPACAKAVRELAGIPGLLGRIDPAVLEHPTVDEPVPATLLPALTREVRRTHRRRVLVTAGVVAAAAVASVTMAITGLDGGDRSPITNAQPNRSASASPAATEIMSPVGHAPVSASLGFESVAWGTRISLVCTYAPSPQQYHQMPHTVTYALFVRTRRGGVEQVGTWRSQEGRTMRLTAATAASRQQITSVEVRTVEGRTVLRLAG